ncbi:MAG: AAA family ATPase [Terricaulis sp.]
MRIAITGTHSTGKSSFLDALQQRLGAAGLTSARVDDLARTARDLGFPILRDHTFASTLWIMSDGLRRELEVLLRAPIVLIDRPPLDALGYLNAALETRKDSIAVSERAVLENLVTAYTPVYDVLIMTELDPTIPLGPDRDDDEVFRRLAGDHIRQLVTNSEIPHLVLRSSNREETIETVLDRVSAQSMN